MLTAAAVLPGCRKEAPREEPEVIVAGPEEQPELQKVMIGQTSNTASVRPAARREEEPEQAPDFGPERSETTGKLLPESAETLPVFMAVCNAPQVRPQTALLLADIVYEFPVRKGSSETGFAVLFSDTLPGAAGPAAAAGDTFLALGREWDALLVANGNSVPGDAADSGGTLITPDAGSGFSGIFFRDRTVTDDPRMDLFVRVKDLATAVPEDRETDDGPERFGFEEGISYSFGRPAEKAGIPLFGSDYRQIEFVYDAETNLFERYEKNSKGKLAESRTRTPSADGELVTEQVAVQNLIIQYVPYTFPDGEAASAELTGNGKCEYFINGRTFPGVWERKQEGGLTQFLLNDRTPVQLEPGITWIVLQPADQEIQITYRGSGS